jgi:diguanylate cyclase (GGDEF)-like protein/PAS domain S-box-containing protein
MATGGMRPRPSKLDTSDDLATAFETSERLRKLVEDRLRETEAWEDERLRWTEERRSLRAMIDQVPDYLFAKDTECRFVIANKAVASDLGEGPNALLGKTDLELHPIELARQFYENEKNVMQSGQPMLDHEEFVLLPTGEKRWLSTSKLPLRNETGSIIGLVGISRDITRRKVTEEQIRHLAYHDQLTGLANRARFEAALSEAAEGKHHASHLLLVDLDGFKRVNDSLGHAAGDELLRQVGERLSRLFGKDGFVGRLGGDEFGVLLAAGNDVAATCEAITQSLSATFSIEGKIVHVGASVGVTAIPHSAKAVDCLREADIALYEAKAKGRGRWQAFERDMAELLENKHRLEEELRAALETSDHIYAVYQPVYAADRRRIVGAESLVRWRHPRAGVLSPGSFIGIAEESGLIELLYEQVLRQACNVLRKCPIPWLAVNVSSVQLHAADFADSTLSVINSMGIDPSRLQLEITESVLLDGSGEAKSLLEALKAAGIGIALDDFGTGYSSLSYLRRFHIDKLKVDRSFVSEVGTRSANAIVEAIVALAHGLDMTVTAEGVETEAQRLYLQNIGCNEIQGYLTSPPVPEAKLVAMLSQSG